MTIMKVCLLGHFSSNLDEGVRNVGKAISIGIEKSGLEVLKIDMNSPFSWLGIRKFNPDLLHFILSPTSSGLFFSKIISKMSRNPKVIISAAHLSFPPAKILQLLQPDMILIQSKRSQDICRRIGFRNEFLFNGVDTEKFKPATSAQKESLRKKFGVNNDQIIYLHLASLRKRRNVEALARVQTLGGGQVLVIGREGERPDRGVIERLRKSGCLVWIRHFDEIEELYKLSDYYIFPTYEPRACIEMPLSILEAMACNLPVISTRFGAIPEVFPNTSGLEYFENESEMIEKIMEKNLMGASVKTRDAVMLHSWNNVTNRLLNIYNDILNE